MRTKSDRLPLAEHGAELPEQDETVPEPAPEHSRPPRPRPDPVRYGDWERDGRCIDF